MFAFGRQSQRSKASLGRWRATLGAACFHRGCSSHIDGDRKNNSIANLHLCRNASEHRQIHANELAEAACGTPVGANTCTATYDAPERLTHIASTQGSYHKACTAAYQRASPLYQQREGNHHTTATATITNLQQSRESGLPASTRSQP